MSRCLKGFPTKDRIIEVAERLFAEKGLDGASMRDITDAAGVNLAAVNYHFGSKNGLISAVFHRHFGPLNEERLAMLDSVEAAAGDGPPSLEAVLDAFIRPAVTREHDSRFSLLMGRCMSEPAKYIEVHIRPHFEPLMRRFDSSVARALPDVPWDEIFWRMVFTIGALHNVVPIWWSNAIRVPYESVKLHDAEGIIRRLVSFAAAGLRSSAPDENLSKADLDERKGDNPLDLSTSAIQ